MHNTHTHSFLGTKHETQPVWMIYNHLCLCEHLLKLYNSTFTYSSTQTTIEAFFSSIVAFIKTYHIYFVHVIHLVYGLSHIFWQPITVP